MTRQACRKSLALWLVVTALGLAAAAAGCGGGASVRMAGTLPDLSGLAWLEDDLFVAVHDAKNPEATPRPRVSLLWLPRPSIGLVWTPVELDWPGPQGVSNDLESAARLPGTSSVLLVESGSGGDQFRRLVLVDYQALRLHTVAFTEWPVRVTNVEGTAVARVGEQWIFLYAEREGQTRTQTRWAPLQLEPLRLGTFQEVPLTIPDPTGRGARSVSALEVDRAGRLYAASAFDPEDDNGPFRSVVWRIGQVSLGKDGQAQVVLEDPPQRLATLDGFKVEGLAVRERADGHIDLVVGTDDEQYGGTLRLLPAQR